MSYVQREKKHWVEDCRIVTANLANDLENKTVKMLLSPHNERTCKVLLDSQETFAGIDDGR